MSQNPEPLEKLLQQMNDRLAELSNQVKKSSEQSQSTEKPTPSKHTHIKDASGVNFDCPECQKIYDSEVAAKALTEFKKKIKEMKRPTLCEGEECTEIYDSEEQEDCPTCHRHGN